MSSTSIIRIAVLALAFGAMAGNQAMAQSAQRGGFLSGFSSAVRSAVQPLAPRRVPTAVAAVRG